MPFPLVVGIGFGLVGLRNVFPKETIAAAGTNLDAKQTSQTTIVLRNAADKALGEPFRRGSLVQPLPTGTGDDDAAQLASIRM